MGKIRVKTLGVDEEEKKQKQEAKKRAEAKRIEEAKAFSAEKKTSEANPVIAIPSEANEKQSQKILNQVQDDKGEEIAASQAPRNDEKPVEKTTKKEKFAAKHAKKRSAKYQEALTLIDKAKMYKLKEALEVLPKLKRTKFDETVELHLNTTSTGISGNVTLPHGTGKQIRVAIASDELIANVEKGVVDFDILIAEPTMMPKLAKVARILGPKGLMPNPKNGTISPKPEEVAKKYEGGAINYKTEAKFPILHLTIGKVSFGEEKLSENIKTLVKAIKTSNIRNATLKSTMSPGIKVDISSL